jgi:hypothetical protein
MGGDGRRWAATGGDGRRQGGRPAKHATDWEGVQRAREGGGRAWEGMQRSAAAKRVWARAGSVGAKSLDDHVERSRERVLRASTCFNIHSQYAYGMTEDDSPT